MRNNLYVGNMANLDRLELEQLLSRFGVVRFAAVVEGAGADRCGGFGVVEMSSEVEASAAIRALNGFEMGGTRLAVRRATSHEQTAGGHPAMFGTMNLPDASGHEVATRAGIPGKRDGPAR